MLSQPNRLAGAGPAWFARLDLSALRSSRVWTMVPCIAVALAAPFAARNTSELWLNLPLVPQSRLLVRLLALFLILGMFALILLLTRIGVAHLPARTHRACLYLFPVLTSMWQFGLAADFFFLLAMPERVALPSFAMDLALSVFSAASVPILWFAEPWWHGFEPGELRQSQQALSGTLDGNIPPTLIDTLDYRIIQLVAATGGNTIAVMVNDSGIASGEMRLRLRKLCALGYLELVEDMHGARLALTPLATDTLALPISLFVWETNDREVLRELASARLALGANQAQNTVVICARCVERLLRAHLARRAPELTEYGQKPIERITLGELIAACRSVKAIGRFEDNVFSALNERRKKIHAIQGEDAINHLDGFIVYTLTEIGARVLLGAQSRDAAGAGSGEAQVRSVTATNLNSNGANPAG